MKIRKAAAFILAAVLIFTLIGCGGTDMTESKETLPSSDAESGFDSTPTASNESEVPSSDAESGFDSTTTTSNESEVSSKTVETEEKLPTVDNDDGWKSHIGDYKLIAFTFDDAPNSSTVSDGNTFVRMIRALHYYHGRGTAFVIGTRLETNGTELLKYALKYGFELGNHTYTHADMADREVAAEYNTEKYLTDQIIKNNRLIEEKCGVTPKFLRASGFHTKDFVIKAADMSGMPLVCGNKPNSSATQTTPESSTSDWSSTVTTEHIYDSIVEYAYDGKIVCLHSTSEKTAEVLPDVLKVLYEQGYRFVTLSELFEYKLGVTDIGKVNVAKSLTGPSGSLGIYGTEDVILR